MRDDAITFSELLRILEIVIILPLYMISAILNVIGGLAYKFSSVVYKAFEAIVKDLVNKVDDD